MLIVMNASAGQGVLVDDGVAVFVLVGVAVNVGVGVLVAVGVRVTVRVWVNVAYRGLPLPSPGERLRVLGMFSFLGSTLPVLHALRIDRDDAGT